MSAVKMPSGPPPGPKPLTSTPGQGGGTFRRAGKRSPRRLGTLLGGFMAGEALGGIFAEAVFEPRSAGRGLRWGWSGLLRA